MKGTLADEWAEYARMVMPRNAPEVQRVEMENSYYAGCWTVLSGLEDSPWRRECEQRCRELIERQFKITGRDN